MSAPRLLVNKRYQIQSDSFPKKLCKQYPYGSVFLVVELSKKDIERQKQTQVPLYRIISQVTGEEFLLTAQEIGTTFPIKDHGWKSILERKKVFSKTG